MILRDEEFHIAALMLKTAFEIMAGIEDGEGRRFNDPSPNWLTAERIQEAIDFFEAKLVDIGAVRITAFSPCGRPEHEERAVWPMDEVFSGTWRYEFEDGSSDYENFDGQELRYNGIVLESNFDRVPENTESSKGPCICGPLSPGHREFYSTASVFAWPKDPESRIGDLVRIVLMMRDSARASQAKRPRSAIREQLLWMVLEVERLLVEETADEAISRRLPDFGDNPDPRDQFP